MPLSSAHLPPQDVTLYDRLQDGMMPASSSSLHTHTPNETCANDFVCVCVCVLTCRY